MAAADECDPESSQSANTDGAMKQHASGPNQYCLVGFKTLLTK